MGSAQTNFYNDAFQRAGYADDAQAVQDLWLQGKREEAARRVPDAMVTEFQAVGTREMVRARLVEWLGRHLRKKLKPLFLALDAAIEAPARGLIFQLSEQLGSLQRRQVRALIGTVSATDRKTLTALGVRFGGQSIFFPSLLRPAVLRLRAILWAAHADAPAPALDFDGHEPIGPCFRAEDAPDSYWAALGYRTLGPIVLRLGCCTRRGTSRVAQTERGRIAARLGIDGSTALAEVQTAGRRAR